MTGRGPALLFALVSLSCGSQVILSGHASDATSSDRVTIRGSARVYRSWCAGMAPSPEAEEAVREGAPMTTPLFVHAGDHFAGGEPIARVTPDAQGQFELALPPGRYCVVFEAHELPSAPMAPEADAACLKAQRAKCDSEWVVDAARARLATGGPIEIAQHRGCDFRRPCFPPGPRPP